MNKKDKKKIITAAVEEWMDRIPDMFLSEVLSHRDMLKGMMDRLGLLEAFEDAIVEAMENTEIVVTVADNPKTGSDLSKIVALLKEARSDLEDYVTREYPKNKHPYYERQWTRDMELCRRIDAALEELDQSDDEPLSPVEDMAPTQGVLIGGKDCRLAGRIIPIAQCKICGRPVDTRERNEGGDGHGCEYEQGWACSSACAEILNPDPEWLKEGLRQQEQPSCAACDARGEDCGEHQPSWEDLAKYWKSRAEASELELKNLKS